ncbi:HNH endonuclease [Sinorhizobium kostiense]|uniref:HNH endonuclease n=1 Tax=Sinorhizobium kostiense TaxID=76747 RepID=UPI0038B4895A
MDCRNARGKIRSARVKANGGSHTSKEWLALLAATPACVECGRAWADIPPRPDPRYKSVWTKGHIVPVYHGGTNDISNIRPECYECNFGKNAGALSKK